MRLNLWLGACLWAAPLIAVAAPPAAAPASLATTAAPDDAAQSNAVARSWDRYVALSVRDDAKAVDLLASSTLAYFGFLRDVALAGSPEQVRRIPVSDRVVVYCLRATQSDAQLAALDDVGTARLAYSRGWSGISAPEEGEPLPTLTHVTVLSPDIAVTENAPSTGTQYQFGPEFVREGGQWKVVTQSTTANDSAYIAQVTKQSGLTETQMVQSIVADMLGGDGPEPNLAVLDQPLRDDAALRTKLNDRWPDYTAPYRNRIRAIERKAADGASLAQFGLGALLYSGKEPRLAKQDKPRGLALLEQASAGGNVMAATLVVSALLEDEELPKDKPIPAERFDRALPHLRRAAEGGVPMAMGGLGDFYFNGLGGLARDCREGEQWQARAEDAGMEHARNNRIWFLAVCPIPEQRDPARALELAGAMIAKADSLPAGELDTLAAVYAANGRFPEAVALQQRAIAGYDPAKKATVRRMKERLKAYQGKLDWTQSYNALSE